MGNTFWNKTNILGLAGLLAYAVTFLVLLIPFKGEPSVSLVDWRSPLGIIVICLFVTSIGLYIWGILKRSLSFNDKKALVEGRRQTLSDLRQSIDRRLKATRPLATKAERMSILQYWDKYLKNTYPYIITKQKPRKPLEITNSLVKHGFMWNNLYYQELKENDGNYKRAVDEYNINYSKIDDRGRKALERPLRWLWRLEHITSSTQIYTTFSMNNKQIPNAPSGYRKGLWGKHKCEESLQDCLTNVENQISKLVQGDDL
jgi:hypothetical protein